MPAQDSFDFAAFADALEPSAGETPAPEPLRVFGDYALEEEIARGGMGVIYRARQISLGRTVALKLLRDAMLASGEELERFQREAAAAAGLRHPNIVRIYEIGQHDEQHFFSMDFIAGPTLAEVLRDGAPAPRRAAEWTLKVTRAIAHAHEHGVLHRDLKPSNVLLDPEGEPQVTDFGLARRDEERGLTLSGQVMGTPAYMAPEQAEGRTRDIGPLTDVYGLGALLYHLLGGRAPFNGDSQMAILKQVTADDPLGPRLLNPAVPVDLETICLKAMSKEPQGRYAHAKAMAEDLERFLAGQPVLARPVSRLHRLWKWTRRHPALAASLAVVVLLLAGIATVSTVAARRLEQTASSEKQARRSAEALIRDMLYDMREKLRPINQLTLLDGVSESAEHYFDTLPQPGTRETEQHRATMLSARSDVLYAKADTAGALAKQRASLAIRDGLLAQDPGNRDYRIAAASSAYDISWLLSRQGNTAEALPYLERSRAMRSALAAERPDEMTVGWQAPITTAELAEALAKAGRTAEAAKCVEDAKAEAARLPPAPGNSTSLSRSRDLNVRIGDALWYLDRKTESLDAYRAALKKAEEAVAARPEHVDNQRGMVVALERVGDLLLENDDARGAREMFERRLSIAEKLSADDPANLAFKADVGAALSRLATTARKQKDTAAALDFIQRGRTAREWIAAKDPDNLSARTDLGSLWLDEAILVDAADIPRGLHATAEALKIFEAIAAEAPQEPEWRRNVATARLIAARLQFAAGHLAEAKTEAETARIVNAGLRIERPANKQYERDTARIQKLLGEISAAEH